MVGPVKRAYDASRRREAARRARARVLDAARARFLADGYAATTIAAIAADADVSIDTVYKAFGNKPGLLKTVFDAAVAGDDRPVPIVERDFVAEIVAEPHPRRKLEMYAAHLAEAMPRAAPLQLLARAAAATDADVATLHEQIRNELLTGMTAFATHLHDGGFLRHAMTVDEARDILFSVNSPELYELLVVERGRSVPEYRDLVARALIANLLP
jgi:AcrR family transcriptional regulator